MSKNLTETKKRKSKYDKIPEFDDDEVEEDDDEE